ncbi:hypothetical protein LDENG_00237110 [Lucifuga dentata]|nr:hypothetical protein LDENG_00237110 [Lucifuga dentata]
MLFVDFSLSFNSINPNKLVNKLQTLGLGTLLCLWIKDFSTNRPQNVRHIHSSNALIKFTDDTTTVGLISNNNDTAYREEVQTLSAWCKDSNLNLNTKRKNKNPKEIITDFQKKKKKKKHHTGLCINGEEVEQVASFKFLGVHVSEDLNTSHLVKKAQAFFFFFFFFLRILRHNRLPQTLLINFCHCTIESILTYC